MAQHVCRILNRMKPLAARLGEAVGRLLFPPHCLVCGRPNTEAEDRYLCRDCIHDIPFVSDPGCLKCGHELGPHVDPALRCALCRDLPLRFDRAVAAAHHAGSARELVLALKFAAQKCNVYPLTKLLLGRLDQTGLADQVNLIVPVPLHRRRLRSRGFNQSELLASELGARLDVPVSTDNLRRVIDTPPQTQTLSLSARRANVKGAFAVRTPKSFFGKSVLLIDDVLTTGATTSECAGALKRAGAAHVFAATVTRRMATPPSSTVPETAPYELEALQHPAHEAPGTQP